ncbi:hypothetical protein BDZ97DRAFT_1794512 [Flammula alnicola]|nr:hypothetical protein BDZ97DRAFT_1794512 [Flammula alnicola]
MDSASKHAHRRMVKVNVQARSPDVATPSATQITVTETANATSIPVVSGLPTSTAAVVAVMAFIVLALILGMFWFRFARSSSR